MFWHWNSSAGNTDLLFSGFNSWCLNSRLSMGWIIFWRLVPERSEMTGLLASQQRSTSYRQLTEGRWHVRKVLLNLSYKTSTWGKPVSPHTHIFIVSSPAPSLHAFLQQSVGLHVWCSRRHQAEQPCGTGQHVQQLFLRWLIHLFHTPTIVPCMVVHIMNNVDQIKTGVCKLYHCRMTVV